jgi:hypothetical protein
MQLECRQCHKLKNILSGKICAECRASGWRMGRDGHPHQYYRSSRNLTPLSKPPIIIVCKKCGKEVVATRRSRKYCDACRRHSEQIKATKQAYFQSEKGKAKLQAYQQSEKGKTAQRTYRRSEKGKAASRRRYLRRRYSIISAPISLFD